MKTNTNQISEGKTHRRGFYLKKMTLTFIDDRYSVVQQRTVVVQDIAAIEAARLRNRRAPLVVIRSSEGHLECAAGMLDNELFKEILKNHISNENRENDTTATNSKQETKANG